MKRLLLFFLFLFILQFSMAQESNRISYEQLGISFIIPQGWNGQEINQGILLQNPGVLGIIFISTHHQSIDQLREEATKPTNDGQGTHLQLAGNIENLSNNSIGGKYQGILEGNPAKCYIIGIANPTGGTGVTILVASQPDQYSVQLQEAGIQLANSFQFQKIDRSSEISEWKNWLSGMRLTYLESYNSPSYTEGGISGGYNIRRVIDLCPQGFFNYGNSSNIQMDGLGMDNSNKKGKGTWDIVLGENGFANLELKDYSGEVHHFRLEYVDQKLYLNGERYFRTNDENNSPDCN